MASRSWTSKEANSVAVAWENLARVTADMGGDFIKENGSLEVAFYNAMHDLLKAQAGIMERLEKDL